MSETTNPIPTTPAPAPQTCYFCGTTGRMRNWSHWLETGEGKFGGEYIRVDYCDDCAGRIVRYHAPKRERVTRTPVRPYGDLALVGQFLGATRKGGRR